MARSSEKWSGAFGKLGKGGRRGVSIAVLGALAATAVGAYAVHSAARTQPLFTLRASPLRKVVTAGSQASFRIWISRRGFRGSISLRVTGTPRGASARLRVGGASLRMLTVATGWRARARRYRLVVRARGGGVSRVIRLVLTIRAARAVPIGISGAVSNLQPGVATPLDLALRNPSSRDVWATSMTVTPKSVFAPRSSALLPCTLTDFSMRQFSGIYPIVLRPKSTRTLSSLGIPAAQRPQVMLLDRALNQDGCQGATVRLAYSVRGMVL